MADRYQDRPFPDDQAPSRSGGSDPLAELARLIGQSDTFAASRNAPTAVAPFSEPVAAEPEPEFADAAPRVPSWMQHRANLRPQLPEEHAPRSAPTYEQPDYAATGDYRAEQAPHDPSRYDEALYGPQDPAYPDTQAYDGVYPEPPPYGEHDSDAEDAPPRQRRTGVMTIAGIVALAVVGTGGAYAYRTFMGGARSGEPPIIKADPTPTKIMPPSAAEGAGKPIQDRLASGGGVETLISREEQPVDPRNPNAGGPRVVLPPLNQNSAATGRPPQPPPNNGTLAGDEPRRIKTLSVRPDQADASAQPTGRAGATPPPARTTVTQPVPPRTAPAPVNANASAANAPLSLSPQSAADQRPNRVAAAPAATASVGASGGYVVQVASQRTEADAQASYRVLQGKFPSVLGSRAPLIKRADLGDKGTYYRATVGPFGTAEEAAQMCGSLKSAGGQCVVQRN